MVEPIVKDTLPPNLNDLYKASLDELEALEPERFIRRMVSRARALELSNVMLGSWGPMQHLLDELLAPDVAKQHKLELARLDRRAWVYYAAELAAEEVRLDTNRQERRELAARVAEHDRFLFKWALPVFGDEYEDTLRDISRGNGARDDAEDVLRLVSLFRDNWQAASAVQQIITPVYLEAAAADAAKQLDLLRNGQINRARTLADAAYTLWYIDYMELMHLGRYLSRGDLDAMTRFPGVREPAVRTSESDGIADEDQPVMDEPATPEAEQGPEAAA
jgi:hypothetical protein